MPDWKIISKIAKRYNLKVIEDSADTIGYKVHGKNLGNFSDITTNSMYASHIITGAGFGGMVCFNDRKLYDKAKLLRGWGRSSAVFDESEGIKKRFNTKVDGIPYDGKYIFKIWGIIFYLQKYQQLLQLNSYVNYLRILKKGSKFRKIKEFFFRIPFII